MGTHLRPTPLERVSSLPKDRLRAEIGRIVRVMMADLEIPTRVILQQLASAIKLVVQVSRLRDGTRRIMSIPEVVAAHDDPVELLPNSIFTETLSVNS